MLNGPGLTVSRFFESISDRELRRFLDPGVLSVLDALFGGRITGDDLRRVAQTLVDFDMLLRERDGRRLVLSLVPEQKRAELEARVGRSIYPAGASDWTEAEVRRTRDFFGLVEERDRATGSATNGHDHSCIRLVRSSEESRSESNTAVGPR